MRELVAQFVSKAISRRMFVNRLVTTGLSLAAAQSVAESVSAVAFGQEAGPEGIRVFEGTAGEAIAEQLLACGVKYIFGNSSSSDGPFYEALVDRPQLNYILTPHEGPGAAMAAGYVKASGNPVMVMETAVVGLVNAMGQMYNAHKEQTPLVFYSYRLDKSHTAGRDGMQEVAYQEEMVGPLTKWHWLARRPDRIAETIRRCFKVAWTPPYGPTYATWHSDFLPQKVRTEIILHQKVDPRMRVRPNPQEVERAARLLVNSKRPLLIVGDEIYRAHAVEKAVELAELLALPVTQARQVYTNFPHTHPLWVGRLETSSVNGLDLPDDPDLVINVGNKLQHGGSGAPIVPRHMKFIDMRIDAGSMGNVIPLDAPLVADVGLGLEDLLTALEDLQTPALRKQIEARAEKIRSFHDRARRLRAQITRSPDWDKSPLLADRLTYELAQFADPDAIVVHEGGAIGIHSFDFNPLGGRELFHYYGAHLGSGVGTAAGVKLARPRQQVIALVGDGSFVFGPTALWNMARLGLPVLVVVYNNHAYAGPHMRIVGNHPGGRMVQTGQFVNDYLGKPDMNMAAIAQGFGVAGEVVASPHELKAALKRARRTNESGKPYLIDAQVGRTGPGWAEQPWVPPIDVSQG